MFNLELVGLEFSQPSLSLRGCICMCLEVDQGCVIGVYLEGLYSKVMSELKDCPSYSQEFQFSGRVVFLMWVKGFRGILDHSLHSFLVLGEHGSKAFYRCVCIYNERLFEIWVC